MDGMDLFKDPGMLVSISLFVFVLAVLHGAIKGIAFSGGAWTKIANLLWVVFAAFIAWWLLVNDNSATLTATAVYGVTLIYFVSFFMLLSYIARENGRDLTRSRGERWVKELDYIYLVFALVGLFFSITKSTSSTHDWKTLEKMGPFLVATAIAIRMLKTRTEINEWHKLPPPLAEPNPTPVVEPNTFTPQPATHQEPLAVEVLPTTASTSDVAGDEEAEKPNGAGRS